MSKAGARLAADADARGSVLIVDDDPATLSGFSHLLQHRGITTYEASTADGAVRSALAHRPDVVVLDNRLGELGETTGVDVIDALHSRSFYPTWILYSGFMDYELATDAGRRNVFCVIRLPSDEFETAVMKALAATYEGQTEGWPLLPVGQLPAPQTNGGKGAVWILSACDSKDDLVNFPAWASLVGTSERRMRELYEQIALDPHLVKSFMRVFRGLTRACGHVEQAVAELMVGDSRTLKRLRERAGLSHPATVRIPFEQFLQTQTFVPVDHAMLAALRTLITARNRPDFLER